MLVASDITKHYLPMDPNLVEDVLALILRVILIELGQIY